MKDRSQKLINILPMILMFLGRESIILNAAIIFFTFFFEILPIDDFFSKIYGFFTSEKSQSIKLCAYIIRRRGSVVDFRVDTEYLAIQDIILKELTNGTIKIPYHITANRLSKKFVIFDRSINVGNLTVKQNVEIKTQDEHVEETSFELLISSKTQKIKQILETVKQIKEAHKQQRRETKPKIFTVSFDEKHRRVIHEHFFTTTKTLDNMFFEQKDEIKFAIDQFNNNENEYIRLGIPYTIGIMLHGDPGTGKTSLIKSIAKYTDRHIIFIKYNKYATNSELKELFVKEQINRYFIPNSKRLYIFEDIDCGDWKHVFQKRTKEEKEKKKKKESTFHALVSADDETDSAKKVHKNNDKVNLSEFLNLLDGLHEMKSRMIIMTSNYPEKLDQALTRPGRIDITIKMNKMSRVNINKMYELWFGEPLAANIYNKVLDHHFSQAEIGQIFLMRNKDKIIKALTT